MVLCVFFTLSVFQCGEDVIILLCVRMSKCVANEPLIRSFQPIVNFCVHSVLDLLYNMCAMRKGVQQLRHERPRQGSHFFWSSTFFLKHLTVAILSLSFCYIYIYIYICKSKTKRERKNILYTIHVHKKPCVMK